MSKRLDKDKTPKNPTGEGELFKEIWAERKHESFLTGDNLDKHFGKNTWYEMEWESKRRSDLGKLIRKELYKRS